VTPEPLPAEMLAYYARAGEATRLFEGAGQIELARTQEIILRHLLPHELTSEVARARLTVLELLGVEGPGWLAPDLKSRWSDGRERELLLWSARVVEREPTLLGLSPHLLVVARRPA
jgi:hypothetical protein